MSTRTVPFLGEIEVTRQVQLALVAVTSAVVLVFPLFMGTYWTNVGIDIMVLILFAMSFNLLFGYTGMLSFGHAAFYGVAAYTVAISLAGTAPWVPVMGSFVPALILGVAVATITAGIFGALAVQRGGVFFAMLTLALNMMLYELVFQWTDVTGGANGTTLPGMQIDLGVIAFDALNKLLYYYFVFVLVFASLFAIWRIVHSPYGELLRAIRENPERSEFVGMNVKYYQWTAFVISGLFAGIAGALVSVQFFVVAPIVVHWSTGAQALLATLLGGPTSFLGPVLGGIVFVILQEFLTQFTQYWQIFLGAILIPIVLFFPGGILGALQGEGGLRGRLPWTDVRGVEDEGAGDTASEGGPGGEEP